MAYNQLKVRITLLEEALGTSSNNPNIHEEYIASKAPNAELAQQEVDCIPDVDELVSKGMTVFPRMDNGQPFMWDYQVKGFLKDACQMLKKVPGTHCSTIKAYKKEIDGLIFPQPRQIPLELPPFGEIGRCQRPLRAQTPQGERVALSDSETVPAGTTLEVTFVCMTDSGLKLVKECLDYGVLRGLGQWRNSGKGRFTWEEIKEG